MPALDTIITLFRRGHVREAIAACEHRLSNDAKDTETMSLLAELLLSAGQDVDALPFLTELARLRPDDAAAHRRLAAALIATRRFHEALTVLRTAIELDPTNARAHNNRGQAFMQMDDIPGATASYREALALEPNYAIAHNNLGLALTAQREFAAAAISFRRALELAPAMTIAAFNLAVAYERSEQWSAALLAYEHALALTPGHPDAYVGRGSVLARLYRFEPALECFEQALTSRSADPAIWVHMATVLLAMERPAESLARADRALHLDEQSADAHNIRAGALRQLGRHAEAIDSLERALALKPSADTWNNHGMVLYEVGETEQAAASHRRALNLDPAAIQTRTRSLARLIPPVPQSEEADASARRAFDAQLLEFESWLGSRTLSDDEALLLAQQQFFYLSYREVSNRAVLQRYRGHCAARLAAVGHSCAPLAGNPRRIPHAHAQDRRCKLGFVSAHVFDHSVFNAILRGWLTHLDRRHFEITLFTVTATPDDLARSALATADQVESTPRSPLDWARLIGDRHLDAVIYPEVGMNETTLALASLRLARRQFVAWGHPETTGLPTIDGYLSAELFEPPDAEQHYTEPLLRLPNLGVHCIPYAVQSQPIDSMTWEIGDGVTTFVCPGVPFKYQPRHDQIFIEIARRLGRCRFVFFEHSVVELSQKLQARLAHAFRSAQLEPALHLASIPWLPRAKFFWLLERADVYLDTIGFSGFNTMMQAIECNLPCVTQEGRYLRGRLGSGILKRLGIPELIAADSASYVSIAVRLAADPQYQAGIRARMRRAESLLYSDTAAVDALACELVNPHR